MEIIINTFIVLAAIQIWMIVGYGVLSCLGGFEPKDSEILSCFCWPLILVGWINIQINEFVERF